MAVAGAEDEQVVVAGPLRLGGEAQLRAVVEADRVEPLELDRRPLRRLPLDPDRPLAAGRRIVDAIDQVPGHRTAVRGAADSGRPVPARVAGVVPGRLVVDREALDLPVPPAGLDRPAHRHTGPLPCPAPALAARADRLDRRAV